MAAAANADDEEAARAAAAGRELLQLEQPGQAARLVMEGSSSRVRQLAAQSVQDPAELKQLLRQLRGKDKSVYKIIKQKCDALRAEEQRIAQEQSAIDALCASLERHSHRIYDVLYPASLRQFEAQWQALEPRATPQARERAQRAMDGCRQVIEAHARRLSEQAAEASQQAALRTAQQQADALAAEEARRRDEAAALAAEEAAAQRAAEEQAHAARQAAEALALRQLGGLMAKASGALRDGNTGRAAGLRRAIEEKLPTVPAVPAYIAGQVHQLDAKLSELKQWKDYAVAPKRAELILEMEALIGSSEEPKALADRIKQLQEDWKTISQGLVSDSEADWQRFHQASVTAYQPCREYFEAQSAQRKANAAKRLSILERLQNFETAQSGEHPDWRAVAAVLREARAEWRRCSPVDRAAAIAVQEQFDASLGRLQQRLDAWHAQNAAEKTALIQRAQLLLDKEDGREAVDGVKRLQLLWKDIGAARRDQEQSLWNEFRERCDAVFQKRQQAYAEHAAALEAAKTRAAALCAEAESVAALSGSELLDGLAKIPQWRAAFEALGELPKAEERTLHHRFERALALCQTRLTQVRANELHQSFAHLLQAARHIQAYGWAVAQDAADRDALKQAAETFIGGVSQWPKGGAQALKDAWTKADAAARLDMAAQETAFKTLCIRAEILAGRTTPAEDQALRREYQVQRLVQHMGRPGDAPADAWDSLALEWVRTGPVPMPSCEALLARFLLCRS
ncbi:MAG TPA: DUF349 domain-containing protein [Steroidobacteraceae bacterium]|nr:DUF349 domain-containing protein [Steroidobacteraceae bacterium]